MPLLDYEKMAFRELAKRYFRTISSTRLLLNLAARDPNATFNADTLWAWWDTLANPAHPEAQEIFSPRELEALSRYDVIIRRFHESSPGRHLPIGQFVSTTEFQEISNAARSCRKAFNLFSLLRNG